MQKTWQIRYALLLGAVLLVLGAALVFAVAAGQPWAVISSAVGLGLFIIVGVLLYLDGIHRIELQSILFERSNELAAQTDLDDLLDHIVRAILQMLPRGNKCVIHLLDDAGRRLYPRYASEFDRQRILGMPANKGIAGQALRERRTLVIDDVQREPEFLPLQSTSELRALMVAPLCAQDKLLGTISLNSKSPRAFNAQDELIFTTLSAQASTAIYQSQLYTNVLRTQQQMEAILNSINSGLIVLNSDNRIRRYNLALQQLFGLERSQLIGKKVEATSDYEALRRLAAILAEHPGEARQTREYELTLDQPAHTVLEVSVSSVLDHDKEWIKIVTLQDKTNALAKLNSGTSLLRATAQDVLAPTEVIRGYATLLAGEDAPALDWGRQIQRQGARLERLSDDLADLAEIEAQTFVSKPAPVAIEVLLGEALDTVDDAARKLGVRIETHYPPKLPPLPLDQDRLRRVLGHLLENALKRALPGGHISMKVEVSLEELTFALVDDGESIPYEEQARIFQGQFRFEDAAAEESVGTGLSLYISRRIIEAEKGHLWVADDVEQGARFQFIVPLEKV